MRELQLRNFAFDPRYQGFQRVEGLVPAGVRIKHCNGGGIGSHGPQSTGHAV
jgi:hypothetical protein